MRDLHARWITAALTLLAVPDLLAGAWGIVATRSWYEDFPGWAPRLVAALPPYNEHLAGDAAAGLFAVGVAAAVALVRRRRDIVLVAMAVHLAFSWPHAAFHLRRPADALTTTQDALNTGVLWAAVVLAVLVATTAWRSGGRPDRAGDAARGPSSSPPLGPGRSSEGGGTVGSGADRPARRRSLSS